MTQLQKREHVKILFATTDLSAKQISVKLKVSLATVYNIKTRCKKNGDISHAKRAGRPNTLQNMIKRSITQKISRKPYLSLRSLANNLPFSVSYETVRRTLKGLEYTKRYPKKCPMISVKNRLYRIQWAKKY